MGDIDAGIVRQIESIYDENFGAGANLTIAKIVRQKPSVYSVIPEQVLKNDTYPVSYTHLTLPTILLV